MNSCFLWVLILFLGVFLIIYAMPVIIGAVAVIFITIASFLEQDEDEDEGS